MLNLYFDNAITRQYPGLLDVSEQVIEALEKIFELDELTFEELEEFVGQDMARHLDLYLAKDEFGIYYKLIGYETLYAAHLTYDIIDMGKSVANVHFTSIE